MDDSAERTPAWERLVQVTTAVFTGWFLLVLFRWHVLDVVAWVTVRLHGAVPVVPVVDRVEAQALVATAIDAGLFLSVVLFLVAFAAFHRATDVPPGAE